jgi:hypothetical protein
VAGIRNEAKFGVGDEGSKPLGDRAVKPAIVFAPEDPYGHSDGAKERLERADIFVRPLGDLAEVGRLTILALPRSEVRRRAPRR